MANITAAPAPGPAESSEYVVYTADQKRKWARAKAADNAQFLSKFLGYQVSDRLPYVLLQVASDVARSVEDRAILKTRICDRSDHYLNSMKVLAVAILHYDMASNLVGTRDRASGKLERCDNSLFASLLDMPRRTVDNVIYSLKRSGLYLSIEQREKKQTEDGVDYRGIASIKRINMVLFEKLGFGQLFQVQRAKAKQRVENKRLRKTPAEQQLEDYRKTDDKLREKRNQQREAGRKKRQDALANQQSQNRTAEILAAMAEGKGYTDLKAEFSSPDDPDPCADIPY